MSGSISWTCPKCGTTKSGYRFQWSATDDANSHLWKRHRIDATKKGVYARAAAAREARRG